MDQSIPQSIDFKDVINKDSYFRAITLPDTSAQTAANYGYVFTARTFGLEIIGISEIHQTAGSDASAVSLDVLTVTNGSSIGYTTGTITSIANGGTAVVGAGTTWTASMVGQSIKIYGNGDGVWYLIASVTNATHLVLASAYQGANIAAATEPYIIGYNVNKASFSLKSTANTTVYKEGKDLSVFDNSRILSPFDSVALITSGTLTDLKGVCVTIYYKWANRGSYR